MRRDLLIVALLVPVLLFGTVAPAQALHWPAYKYDRIAWSWEYYAPYSTRYNCLAYSLGITTRWIWPWDGDPSALEVNSYMKSKGHPATTSTGGPRIIAYSPSPNRTSPSRTRSIDHFSRVIATGKTRAKWGSLEVMTSYSWSPYYTTSYGLPATYYR